MQTLIFLTAVDLILCQSIVWSSNVIVTTARWVLLALLCLRYWSKKRPKHRPLYACDYIAIALFFMVGLSVIGSISRELTIMRGGSIILFYLAVFWSLWDYADERDEHAVMFPLLVATGLCFAVSMAMMARPDLAWQGDGRFRGLLLNPNSLGLLGAICLPLFTFELLAGRHSRLFRIFTACAVVCLLLSGSRNGIISAFVGVMFVLLKSGQRGSGGINLVLPVILIFLLGLGFMIERDGLDSFTRERWSLFDSANTASGRFEIWPVAVDEIMNSPWIGHGFGTEEIWMLHGNVAATQIGFLISERTIYMHNSYLGLSYQIGLPAAAGLYLVLIVYTMANILRALSQQGRFPVYAYISVMVIGLFAAAFESWIYAVGNAFCLPFWTCTMLMIRRRLIGLRRAPIAVRTARDTNHLIPSSSRPQSSTTTAMPSNARSAGQ